MGKADPAFSSSFTECLYSEGAMKMMIKVKVVKVMRKAMQMVKVVAPGVKLMTRSLLSRSTWLRSLEPS